MDEGRPWHFNDKAGAFFAVLITVGVIVWIIVEYKRIKWYVVVSSALLAAIFALLFVQFGPGMGNSWYRNVGENGEMRFAFGNIPKVLLEPLSVIWLWMPIFWPMNIYVLFPAILIAMTYIIPK
jgi:hypothetical protein